MTGIPVFKFPTDNLYKFIAIFGLIVFVAALSFPLYYQDKVEHEKVTFMLNSRKAEMHMNELMKVIEHEQYYVDSIRMTGYVFNPIIVDESIDSGRHFEVAAKFAFINQMIDNYYATNDTLMANHAEYDYKNFIENRILKICNFSIIFGVMLACTGFYFWFNNFQLYKDIVLQKSTGHRIKSWDDTIRKRRRQARWVTLGLLFFLFLISRIASFSTYASLTGTETNVGPEANGKSKGIPLPND